MVLGFQGKIQRQRKSASCMHMYVLFMNSLNATVLTVAVGMSQQVVLEALSDSIRSLLQCIQRSTLYIYNQYQ